MRFYTLGPIGSFSWLGSQQFLESQKISAEISPAASFFEIFEKVETEAGVFGIIPVENYTTSNVHENIDLLFQRKNVQILAEFKLQIKLHLIAAPSTSLETLSKIYSHEKALAQCSGFLRKFSAEKLCPVSSTSQAAEISRLEPASAFVGPRYLCSDGLEIVTENIADHEANFTRFVVIAHTKNSALSPELKENKPVSDEGRIFPKPVDQKATFIFETVDSDQKGSLAKVLTLIAEKGGNLLKIESRPVPETPGLYAFWADIDLREAEADLMKKLESVTKSLRILGCFDHGETFASE